MAAPVPCGSISFARRHLLPFPENPERDHGADRRLDDHHRQRTEVDTVAAYDPHADRQESQAVASSTRTPDEGTAITMAITVTSARWREEQPPQHCVFDRGQFSAFEHGTVASGYRHDDPNACTCDKKQGDVEKWRQRHLRGSQHSNLAPGCTPYRPIMSPTSSKRGVQQHIEQQQDTCPESDRGSPNSTRVQRSTQDRLRMRPLRPRRLTILRRSRQSQTKLRRPASWSELSRGCPRVSRTSVKVGAQIACQIAAFDATRACLTTLVNARPA